MELIHENSRYIITHGDDEIAVAASRNTLMSILNQDPHSRKFTTVANYATTNHLDLDAEIISLREALNTLEDPEHRWDNTMAREILAQISLIYIDPFNEWYEYNTDLGYYELTTKTSVKGIVKTWMDNHRISAPLQNGYETLQIRAEYRGEMNDHGDWMNVKNGILNRTTLQLIDHSPEYKFTYRMEVQYNATPNPTPTWDRYLTESPDDSEIIKIWMNCLFKGRRENEFMLWLVGPPNSGKSTLITLFQHIFENAGMSTTSLMSLGGSFGLQNIIDSYLNVDADINEKSFGAATISVFKKLMDTVAYIDVNKKNARQTTMKWNGFFLGASNNLAQLPRNTDIRAVMKRIAFVRFPNIFPNNEIFKADLLSEIDDIFSTIIQLPYTQLKTDVEAWIIKNQQVYYNETNHIYKMINEQYKVVDSMSYAPFGTRCEEVYATIMKRAREIGVIISPYTYQQEITGELLAMGVIKKQHINDHGSERYDIFYGLRTKGALS